MLVTSSAPNVVMYASPSPRSIIYVAITNALFLQYSHSTLIPHLSKKMALRGVFTATPAVQRLNV